MESMEKGVTQRVNELRAKYGLSILALSRQIKVNQTTLNKQLKENGVGVSIDTVVLMLEAFPGLSAEWLLRGTGDMGRVENKSQVTNNSNDLVEALKDHITTLKEINASLKAENEALKREKSYESDHGHHFIAAEEITYNSDGNR